MFTSPSSCMASAKLTFDESQAALDKHWASERYQEVMNEMQTDLLVDAPLIIKGNIVMEL